MQCYAKHEQATLDTHMITMAFDYEWMCGLCGESKDPRKARVAHVRLGLDEPPEPVVCKCKSAQLIVQGVMSKFAASDNITSVVKGSTMGALTKTDLNPIAVTSVSSCPNMELELRLSPVMSLEMFNLVLSGFFGQYRKDEITETGCSWWTGRSANMNAKVRKRSNGENSMKVTVYKYNIAPGMTLALSAEYSYTGTITRPDYATQMTQLTIETELDSVPVVVLARMYNCEGKYTYSCEVELDTPLTHMNLRRVMRSLICVAGSVKCMSKEVSKEYAQAAASVDHAVLDVSDMSAHKGVFMVKADGMKVYILCYSFGYVVTLPDVDLTVISCTISVTYGPLYEMTNMPDIMVAEMMVDGTLVYIDTLAANSMTRRAVRKYVAVPSSVYNYPSMIVRPNWATCPSEDVVKLSSVAADGLVCVTMSKTVRMKTPTIDLMYVDGALTSRENGLSVAVVQGHESMKTGVVYELTVSRGASASAVSLTKPYERKFKKYPNGMDVVRRAFISACRSPSMNTSLFDCATVSFAMRTRVYEMTQASANATRRVIVTFGAGRLQEWKQMKLESYSYIAVDPDITITRMIATMKGIRVIPYDFSTSLSTHISSISNRPRCMLYCSCDSEYFITRTNAATTMCTMGVPAVFSFSMSYHIRVINTLAFNDVSVFGCGYVHDYMPDNEDVGTQPVVMRRVPASTSRNAHVVSTFGKSTYVEPVMSARSVRGLRSVKSAMPEVWSVVDNTTIGVMSRAVVMY